MHYVKHFGYTALAVLGAIGMITLLGACGVPTARKVKAADTLACVKEKVKFEAVDQYGKASIATGCDKKDVIAEDDAGKVGSLRERAAYEMSCAVGELDLVVIDSTTYGITGCNRKITYKYNRFVGFVVQSTSEQAPPPAAPAEPAAAAEPT